MSFKFVTNEDFVWFTAATRHRTPPHWLDGEIPAGTEAHPVVFVSAEDADAYCAWAGRRLPTDEEAAAVDATRPPFLWEWTSTTENASRVVRCGSWTDRTWNLRASYRVRLDPAYRDVYTGFRCTRKEQANG